MSRRPSRRPAMRRIRLTLVVIGVVLLGIVAGIGGVLWESLPGGTGELAIARLSAPVDITLDSDGIPRIHAANELDAAAALGFMHARDRMFQMDLMRRAAAGELSEIVGPATLPSDRMMRTLGVSRAAAADLRALPPNVRKILQAYARGVNAWIAQRGRFAAPEFILLGAPRPWTDLDCLLWAKTMGLYLSGNWRTELARLSLAKSVPARTIDSLFPPAGGPGHPEASLLRALPRFPQPFTQPSTASDEWAVDGAHSVTGKPLLAGDPHLAFGMPGIWYLARIDTPQGVLAGATAPGVPFMVIGRNSHIAWTFTSTGADVQDLFIETPVGTDQYQTPDGPRAYATRQETIAVRGQAPETLTVRETIHGPVISDLAAPGGPVLAVSMANLTPGDTAAAGLWALNQATDVDQAGQAAAEITSPVQNLLVADSTKIGLFVTGRVPIRKAGDGEDAQQGADGAHDWIGWASGAQLPHYVAPASGRLVNGNERVAPPDFPVFLGRDWPGDWRARRIRALLDGNAKHSVADFTAMQVDDVSQYAEDLLPILLRTSPADDRARMALGLLGKWSGAMDTDKPQPLIFNAWMNHVHAALLAGLGLSDSGGGGEEMVADALERTHCGGDCGPMLSRTLSAALADLTPRFGNDPAEWQWGRAHRAVFAHPLLRYVPVLNMLGIERISSPGDDTTLFRGGMAGASFAAVHGASYRGVYDLSDLDRSRFAIVPGQSGNPLRRLAWNFVQRWRAGGTVALGPKPDSISAEIRLNPAGVVP